MQPFDTFIAVDWSAASTPVKGENSIWISCRTQDGKERLINLGTRAEAEDFLAAEIQASKDAGSRLLMGFDLPFGYPPGFANALGCPAGKSAWRYVWERFERDIEDGPDNKNNRFAIASQYNEIIGFDEGPFWGCPKTKATNFLSPFRPKTHVFPEKRLSELPVPKSQPGWKLAYIGSVGSQGLMGIPVLQRLRQTLGVTVWPFEDISPDGPVQAFVEVYLTLWPVPNLGGPCKDSDQVSAMTERWRADQKQLHTWLQADLPSSAKAEEGWVLGVEP